jgi:hypothetical protein
MSPIQFHEGVNAMSNDKPGRAVLYRAALLCALACAIGCGDDDAIVNDGGSSDEDSGHHESPPRSDSGEPDPMDAGRDATEPLPDGSNPEPDSGGHDAGAEPDSGTPLSLGGLTVSTTREALEDELDLFGAPGHRFWFEIDEAQLESLNADRPSTPGGGPGFPGIPGGGGNCNGEIYCPGDATDSGDPKYADHVLVEDVETGAVADYGKVEIRLVGETTFNELTELTIPNLRVDTNEFQEGQRIGTFEHFRLNSGAIGSIFREGIAHRIYRALGYPGLRSSFALVGNNVWGDDVWTPMVLIEMYKRRFCNDHQDLLGGTCENMWEFSGDIGYGYDPDAPYGEAPTVPSEWCQVSECDDSRLAELMTLLAQTERGPGFKAAVADYIDWDRFHQFQCLSWIMSVGDDAIHASNNSLIIERDDGKLIWAPYSMDLSAGHEWIRNVPLTGDNAVAQGCQADGDCWEDTIAVCEDLVDAFDALNPEELVDETFDLLSDLEMLRYGDDDHAEELRTWLVERQLGLAEELERFRYLPDQYGNCPGDLQRCEDNTCGTAEQCEGRCHEEQVWCETFKSCRFVWQSCPQCSDASPHYCSFTASCVADQAECQALCDGAPEYAWCEAYNECIAEDACPNGDDDGGVPIGGAGGIGGGGIGGMLPPLPID